MNDIEKSLDLLANILQIKSYEILVEDFNNTDLMRYLKHQDELLDTIIRQNKEIKALIEGDKNGYIKEVENRSCVLRKPYAQPRNNRYEGDVEG